MRHVDELGIARLALDWLRHLPYPRQPPDMDSPTPDDAGRWHASPVG
jgi:hypothetical protein